jgi:aspartyl-tRNA synthetase
MRRGGSRRPGIDIGRRRKERTRKATSELETGNGQKAGPAKEDEFKLLWVLDFPLFEYARKIIAG